MKVRYRIIPKNKKGPGFYVETKKQQVTVKAMDTFFASYDALRTKLSSWYSSQGIKFDSIPSNSDTECCFSWHLDPKTGEGMDHYYYGGGCGVGEYLEELDYARKEENAIAEGVTQDFISVSVDSLDDSYDYIPDYDDDCDFQPFNEGGPDLNFFDDSPITCNYKIDENDKSVSSHSSGVSFSKSVDGSSFTKKGKNPSNGPKPYKDATEEGMIFGGKINGNSIPIMSVQENRDYVVFEGVIVGELVLRPTKKGNALLSGSICDDSNSMKFIKFFNSLEEGQAIEKKLKSVKAIRMAGSVNNDEKFEHDFVFKVRSAEEIRLEKKVRTENRPDSRVELHLHTKMSDKDALVGVKELLQTVKAWGHPAVAITDHGVVQTFPEAQQIAKGLGVKVIYGVEAYLINDEFTEEDAKKNRKREPKDKVRENFHIILLAQNQVGLRNLYKMISMSHIEYFKRRPRLPRAVIEEHREGIIVGSACEAGELMQAIVHTKPREELLKIAKFYDYLEVQPICNNEFLVRAGIVPNRETLIEMNKTVCELGDALNKKVVATCDVHYLNPEDKIYREIMLTASGFKDAKEQPDLHLRTTDEMLEEFQYLGEEKAYEIVVTNSRAINDSIDMIKPVPDGTYSPKIQGSEEALTDMCYRNAKAIYGDPLPKVVQDRLDYELERIVGHGYAVLYYIAHKLVKKSLDDGYLVGSRGSVGSSFAATMAEITEVNPLPPHYVCPKCKWSEFYLKGEYPGGFDLPRRDCPECGTPLKTNGHDIPFAIFMGFNGDKVPDIDLNFSGDYQAKAHKYTEELFGRDNVFKAGTIGTIAAKTAFGYVRKYAEINGIQARNGFFENLAKGFTGVKNTTGQHPGGIMVCPRDMDVHHFTPIQRPANKMDCGVVTTHFDYHSIEGRMTKLDILGHDDPTIIRMLEDLTGIDVQTIPFDDPATLSLFSSTEAIGLTPEQLQGDKVASLAVPECGTSFVRKMLEDSRPQHFSDLVRISGFSHGTNVWLDNAQTLIKEGTCKLNEAISTRDDVMNYLRNHGMEDIVGFKVMENVRKGKGIDKKDKLGNPESEYEKTMREGGIPEWFINSCKKISYLFPRAHAVAYVMMAFRIAWFKVNYPLAFYAAYFSIRAKAFDLRIMTSNVDIQLTEFKRLKALDKKASPKDKDMISALEVSMEMRHRGYEFINVDIRYSGARRFSIKDGKLLPPFVAVDSLGETVADLIVEEREKKMFTSIKDVQRRCKVSQTIIDNMIEMGCFHDLPDDEQMSLF